MYKVRLRWFWVWFGIVVVDNFSVGFSYYDVVLSLFCSGFMGFGSFRFFFFCEISFGEVLFVSFGFLIVVLNFVFIFDDVVFKLVEYGLSCDNSDLL